MAAADFLTTLIEGLTAEAPHPLSPREMAEILWLARLPLERPGSQATRVGTGDTTPFAQLRALEPEDPEGTPAPTPHDPRKEPTPVQPLPPSDDPLIPFFPPAPIRARPDPEARLLPAELLPGAKDIPGLLPLQLAEAPLFQDSFSVLRVFQPLMARVPSAHRFWLDEIATVDAYAETRILSAVMQPVLEPCFRVLVVLDAGVGVAPILWTGLTPPSTSS